MKLRLAALVFLTGAVFTAAARSENSAALKTPDATTNEDETWRLRQAATSDELFRLFLVFKNKTWELRRQLSTGQKEDKETFAALDDAMTEIVDGSLEKRFVKVLGNLWHPDAYTGSRQADAIDAEFQDLRQSMLVLQMHLQNNLAERFSSNQRRASRDQILRSLTRINDGMRRQQERIVASRPPLDTNGLIRKLLEIANGVHELHALAQSARGPLENTFFDDPTPPKNP